MTTADELREKVIDAITNEEVGDYWAQRADAAIRIVLEEAVQKCDEFAKLAMTDEFSVGGCVVTKVAAKVLAKDIRALMPEDSK